MNSRYHFPRATIELLKIFNEFGSSRADRGSIKRFNNNSGCDFKVSSIDDSFLGIEYWYYYFFRVWFINKKSRSYKQG